MKAIFYFLVTIMLFTSATCKKAQRDTPLEKQLIGAWKYSGRSGGYAGKSEKADPAISNVLQFESKSTYIQKVNDQVSEQGSYELYKAKSIYSGKEEDAIRFSSTTNNSSKNGIISLRNDTLNIADNIYDGFTTAYVRIK